MTVQAVRPVQLDEAAAARAVLDRDPVVNVFVAARLEAALQRARTSTGRTLLDRASMGGDLWAYAPDGEIEALCFAGGNVVPVGADPVAIAAFGAALSKQPRWAASMVGPADAVLDLWRLVAPSWGPARAVRPNQPLLVVTSPPRVAPDDGVRRRDVTDLDTLFPASVAMFTEEVGVSPMGGDGGAAYRARLREIIAAGHSFARIDDGPAGPYVLFKAEVGYATSRACQVQGVWVPPERRGEGIGVAGMAAIVDIALREIAPVVSLYVNDYNEPARAVYDRVGFVRSHTFATVLP